MKTLEQIMTGHCEVPEHLVAQAEVPVLSDLQVQGDVAIIPMRAGVSDDQLVPAQGVAVVRGENGGNTHLLVADGVVYWRPAHDRAASDLDLGVVTVADGGIGYLLHPEHGANALAPGSYMLRRQREQADEIRRVED